MRGDRSTARAIRGPITLITVGVLFALQNFTPYGFDQTWPVLLIVFGLLSLVGRSMRRSSRSGLRLRRLTTARRRAARTPATVHRKPAIPRRLRRRLRRPAQKGGFGGSAYRNEPPSEIQSGRHRMRRRSITGPLLLLIVGGLFLWNNFHPETRFFDMLANYWPFLLILWGVLRLIEVVWPGHDARSGSFTGGEVVLIVLICIVGSAVWAGYRHGIHFNSGGLDVFGEAYDYPFTARAPAAGIKRIVFRQSSRQHQGDRRGWRTRSWSPATRPSALMGGPTPTAPTATRRWRLVPEGDRLLVRSNQEHAPDNQRISDDMEVTVPRGVAVEARGRRGDYEVTDISADVELASDRGDVRLATYSTATRGWRSATAT